MALFVRQDENRSELQKRLATELQERAKREASKKDLPDGVDDSQFIEGTKRTTGLAWAWIAVIALAFIAAIWIVIATSS